MKKLIVLLFVALIMLNCKNKEQKTENSNSPSQEVAGETTAPLDLGCYIFNDGKNTVSLEIIENSKEIKGNLTYALAEKDKNSGSFTGELQEGILIANYTFQSEGKESIRQVAFKVDGNTLIEGYGELNNGGTAFKDTSSLNFTTKMPLSKTDCNNLKKACLFEDGKAYSELKQSCLELATIKTKLNPLKDGARTDGDSVYVLFNSDNSKAEIFLPKSNKGSVLEKSKQGYWTFENYTLISWKGYVLQEKGVAIYGG
jgi:hypothetical protein